LQEFNPLGEPLTWTVYGRRRTGVDGTGKVLTAGVHADRLPTRDMAVAFVMKEYIKYGDAVDAVVVEMTRDAHGCRKVIHRVGQGKAWWE